MLVRLPPSVQPDRLRDDQPEATFAQGPIEPA